MAADPLWINASAGTPAYSAAELRQAMALPMMYDTRVSGARQGVRPGGGALLVSLVGSTISVARGPALVDPGLTTNQGPYWVGLPAAETHTLTAADAVNPRKDIVIFRVYDHDEDASGLRTARSEYLAGVASGSPAEPAVPAGSFRLATIDVPASGGGSPVVTDRRPYTVATGGILPVRLAGDIAAGEAGRYRHRLDTGVLEVDTGAAWTQPYRRPVWARKTANQSVTNSTVLTNDTQLLGAVEAGVEYDVDIKIFYEAPTANDLKVSLSWPASGTLPWGLTGLVATATATSGDVTPVAFGAPVSGVDFFSVGGAGVGNVLLLSISGTLFGHVAGNVRFMFAQSTAGAATSATVRAGSTMLLTPTAW